MLSVNASPAGPRARRLAHRSCVRFNGLMDLNRIPSSTHGHDFTGGQSRVVMVRKTEQRTFAAGKNGEEPKFETVTRETVQTFSGNRSQKSTSEKRDVFKGLPQQLRSSLEPAAAAPGKPGTSRSPQTPQSVASATVPKKTQLKEEPTEDYSNFARECLEAHNSYRAKHRVPPLKLNRKMCQFSEEWAKRMANTGRMEHRPKNEYGENLFCVWSSDPNHKVTGREPVDNWYAEIKDHVFGKEPRDLKSGHFTQVVWKDSRTLGVGIAKNRGGHTFVVANYDPPGNFIGSFATQVLPVAGYSTENQQVPSEPEETVEDPSDSDVREEGLRIHNELRAKHGVPPLVLDEALCRYAEEWASTLARENKFQHRTDGVYGENIFCHWSSDVEAAAKVGSKEALEAWYNEIKDFEFGVEPRILKSGHFTQVIWKNSQKLGIGRVRVGGRVLVVANYDPRGNYIGQFGGCVPPVVKQ